MRKIKFLTLLVLMLGSITSTYAQGSRVKIDGEYTENQKKAAELFSQRRNSLDKIGELAESFESDYGQLTRSRAHNEMSKEQLSTFIQEMQSAIQARKNLNIVDKYESIQRLYDRENALLNGSKSNTYTEHADRERSYINRLKDQLNKAKDLLYNKGEEKQQSSTGGETENGESANDETSQASHRGGNGYETKVVLSLWRASVTRVSLEK